MNEQTSFMPGISNRLILRLILVLITAAGGTLTVFALDPEKAINQYGHDVWLLQNGLPANSVNVVRQTADGYLWVGTSAGLFRFDGVQFQHVATDPLNNNNPETIVALCESRDRSLWVGTAYNGLRRLKDGKILVYGNDEGFPERQIRAVFESRAGNIWVGTSNGLFKSEGGKFINIPIDPSFITSITEDLQGRIWVGTHAGVRIFLADREVQTLKVSTTSVPVEEVQLSRFQLLACPWKT